MREKTLWLGAAALGVLAGIGSVVAGRSREGRPASGTAESEATRERDPRPLAGSRSGPPRLSVQPQPEKHEIVADPRAAGYDAAALALLKQPADVFRSEPRDERWAPVMEKTLADQMKDDLAHMLPGVDTEKVSCHTGSCRAEFVMPASIASEFWIAIHATPYAEAVQIEEGGSKDGRARMALLLMLSRDHREPADYRRWHQTMREKRLRRIRQWQDAGDSLSGPDAYAARLIGAAGR